MNKEGFKMGVWVGFTLGVMMAVGVGLVSVMPNIRASIQQLDQHEAVKAGAGKWQANEDGSPQFAWRSCNALGVKQ